jgi:GT2 family glycosyltransferase/glycosyltransferase involved in cell wall biosynthesis
MDNKTAMDEELVGHEQDPTAAGRKCVLVLGMHRSGTSALTRVLSLFGADLPKNVMAAHASNEAGHWEPVRLVAMHDEMLAEAGSGWDDWRAFDVASLGKARGAHYKAEIASLIAEEYGDANLFVIKDPRICRFVGLYEEVLSALDITPLYVLTFRNPLAVLKSLASRNGMTAPYAGLLWLRHVLDADEKTRGKSRAIISYEQLIADWQDAASAIGACLKLVLPPSSPGHEAEAFLRSGLRHHAPSFDEFVACPNIAAWVKDTYVALLALEEGRGTRAAHARLDNIRAAFNAAAPVFGDAAFQELRAREDKLITRNNAVNQELNQRDANISRQQAELGSLRHQLAEQEATAATLQKALVERASEIGALQKALVERASEIGAMQQVLADRSGELALLDEGLAEREARIATLDLALSEYRVTINSLEAKVRALFTSTSWRITAPLRSARRFLGRFSYSAAGFAIHQGWRALRARSLVPLLEWRALGAVARSGLFERDWYLKTHPDVAAWRIDPIRHYVAHGALEGRDPSPSFSTRAYLSHNPDVAEAGVNPLVHFVLHGATEGRKLQHSYSLTNGPDRVGKKDTSTSWRIASPLRVGRRLFDRGRLSGVKRALARFGLGAGVEKINNKDPVAASSRAHHCRQQQPHLIYISEEWHTPGNNYRVVRYVEAARFAGSEANWMRLEEVPKRVGEFSAAHAVVIWRAAWDERVAIAVAAARRAGARIVFDVDDLMIDPKIACTSLVDGIRSQGLTEGQVRTFYAQVQRTMLEADVCTTTTEELASHMRAWGKPTFVLPNGYDGETLQASRLAVRRRRQASEDDIVRIGYASGSRTHQRDFAVVAGALGRILRERPHCRLVLFRPCLDITEYPELTGLENQVEWRDMVSLEHLPAEMARFDVNLAPLEVGNPFCEAKSELKFFEAALVDVVTVASPTGPLRRAIRDGETGFLAANEAMWHSIVLRLVDEPVLRRQIAQLAKYEAMRKFGPMRRIQLMANFIAQLSNSRDSAYAFELQVSRLSRPMSPLPRVPESEVLFASDRLGMAEVTVIVPLYNYAHFVREALESVRAQTLSELDLIIVDDASTDNSLPVALEWAQHNAERFNRLLVLRNVDNAGLGPNRNVGFDAADTAFVLPLDADNQLLPECCECLLAALRGTDVAFAYPTIQKFGEESKFMGNMPYEPVRFVGGNFIDAMALVSKEAWASVGGYENVRFGWEDYDFWCRLAEHGLRGTWVRQTLAKYRVHASSMLRATTERPENKQFLLQDMNRRHAWLALVDRGAPQVSWSDRSRHKPSTVNQSE